MRAARAGMFEYELEAELLHEFRRSGAQYPAYTPIVAAGANACVLHYSSNSAQSRDGDLVLIDAGCELDSYASDITRTFPVNGRFTAPQKQLYELVLAAQSAALAAVRPGRRYSDVTDSAVEVLAQGMLDTGLLDKAVYGSADNAIAGRAHLQFYMHGTGHWLGLDVHDVPVGADVVHVESPPAAGAVHVEPQVGAPGAGVVRAAVHRLVAQAGVEPAPRPPLDGPLVPLALAPPRPPRRHRRGRGGVDEL